MSSLPHFHGKYDDWETFIKRFEYIAWEEEWDILYQLRCLQKQLVGGARIFVKSLKEKYLLDYPQLVQILQWKFTAEIVSEEEMDVTPYLRTNKEEDLSNDKLDEYKYSLDANEEEEDKGLTLGETDNIKQHIKSTKVILENKLISFALRVELKHTLVSLRHDLKKMNEQAKSYVVTQPGDEIEGRNISLNRQAIINMGGTSQLSVHGGTLQIVPEGQRPSHLNDINMYGTQGLRSPGNTSSIQADSAKSTSWRGSGPIKCNRIKDAPRSVSFGDREQDAQPGQLDQPNNPKVATFKK